MPHFESESHVRAFDFFRGKKDIDVDWVKLQVYGKPCVPEEFPRVVSDVPTIMRRIQGMRVTRSYF